MKRILVSIFISIMLVLAMAVPAFAVEAVPSIEQKGVPEVVSTSDESIELVPLYSADSESELREAYEEAKELDLGDDLVIRDIFEVVGNVESGSITVDISKYEGAFVALEYIDGNWEEIPASRIVFNDDGTVTIYLDELCPLAFATGTIEEGEGECPFFLCRLFNTDIACNITHCLENDGKCSCWVFWLLFFIVILALLFAIGFFLFKKTKKQEKNEKVKAEKASKQAKNKEIKEAKAKAKEEKAKAEARARREERKKNK